MGWFKDKDNGSSPDETLTALQEELRTLVTKDNIEKLVELLQNGGRLLKSSDNILYTFRINADQAPDGELKRYIRIRSDRMSQDHSYKIYFGTNFEVTSIEPDKISYLWKIRIDPENLLESTKKSDIRQAKRVLGGAGKVISQLTKDDIRPQLADPPAPPRRRGILRPGL